MASKKTLPKAGRKYQTLDEVVRAKVNTFESQAEASRQLDIGKTYLSRMLSGVKDNPSDDILSRMGITRHVHYTIEA